MLEIPPPQELHFNQVTDELIQDVAELGSQINERRPISTDVLQNIHSELLGERVYNSNAIEGNTLTLRETRSILEAGRIIDVGRKREATEALNLGKAIAGVQPLIHTKDSWSDKSLFLAAHGTLLAGIMDNAAGVVRSERVMITGAKYQPPHPTQLHDLIAEFFSQLGGAVELEPVRLATWVHWGIARMHPFMDGNGRMARLWQDLILFGNRLTASVIRYQDRNEYYTSLSAADANDFNPLTQLVARSLIKTLQIYVNAQRESDELKNWASEIVGETTARLDEKRKLEYLRWSRQVDQIRDAFERCATQITGASDGNVGIEIRAFDIVDQPTWETLRSGGRAAKTWFFWANFRRGAERIQYCFFFGTHLFSSDDREYPTIGSNACLLVSEQIGEDNAIRLTDPLSSPVTLREVLVVNDKIVRKRYDVSQSKFVYDLDIDSLTLAREFVQEVLLIRMS